MATAHLQQLKSIDRLKLVVWYLSHVSEQCNQFFWNKMSHYSLFNLTDLKDYQRLLAWRD